jgi:uncharacterized protein YegP (UPF0339 family)
MEGGCRNMAAKFEIYKDANGEFRWGLIASNGQPFLDLIDLN